jgi:hypothetical protein
MSELKEAGRIVATVAELAVPALIQDEKVPSVNTRAEAVAAIERIVTQSPKWQSERVWATVFGVLTAVLAVPEVQVYLGPWAPVATAALTAVLAGWSKATDPRPTR